MMIILITASWFHQAAALLVEGSHLSSRRQQPCLAVLMAGPFGCKMQPEDSSTLDTNSYATAFYDHMIAPLLPEFRVALMIASEPNQTSDWETWCQPFHGLDPVRITEGAPLPDREATRFSDALSTHRDRVGYYWQYGHLRNSYELMKQHEAENNVRFDYIVKARQDFMYKPDNFMMPGWFFEMAANDVAVPSTEFHRHDRWMERKPTMWPERMCDQVVFGPRPAMDQYFNLFWSKSTLPEGHKDNIEGILADHIISCNLHVITVEFQVSQPGGHFVNGAGGNWVTTPCELCMPVNQEEMHVWQRGRNAGMREASP